MATVHCCRDAKIWHIFYLDILNSLQLFSNSNFHLFFVWKICYHIQEKLIILPTGKTLE